MGSLLRRGGAILTAAMVLVMGTARAESLGKKVRVCSNPQMTGALGAAILAARQLNGGGA